MFQLTESEVDLMVSQNVTPSKSYFGGRLPYVFTEQGVAMLAGILRSDKAIKISIEIINAFVLMRKVIKNNSLIDLRLDNIERKHLIYDKKFEEIFDIMNKVDYKQGIFYDGQTFDAYLFVSDLITLAQKSIILIDNFIDYTTLNLFIKKKNNVKITIYTKQINESLKLDLLKFKEQYFDIKVLEFNKSHDRFLIIDDDIYHIGASLKDLGKKWFAFSKLEIDSLNFLKKLN